MSELRDKKKKYVIEFLTDQIAQIGKNLSGQSPLDFLESVEQLDRRRAEFISTYRGIPIGSESFFVVLRKWNSYTPTLPADPGREKGTSRLSIGGGYFLFVQGPENSLDPGYGLVIDPGYNFIHNFGLAGFCLDDIDGILITHAHNDHTNDFESILSLLYERNNKHIGRRRPKKVDLFLNVGSFKKFSNYLDLASKDLKNYIGRVMVLSPGQSVRIPDREGLDCEILTLHTNHHEIVTADYSLGICFKVGGRNILLTGDTGWKFETAKRNEEFLKNHDVFTREESARDLIDVLVTHIGTIKRNEFIPNEDGSLNFYDKHLGILGTISMIEQWKPDLCIVSEFGEELSDIRMNLIEAIEKSAKLLHPKIRCIAGDVGLFVLIDAKKILCYLTGKPVSWESIESYDKVDAFLQKSIKYVSHEALANLADRDTILETINVGRGLQHFKKYYCENVVYTSFQIENASKERLIKEISEATIDYGDVTALEEQEHVKGLLIALTYMIGEPFELISCLENGCYAFEVAELLGSYYQIDVELLNKFAQLCLKRGFDDSNKSTEEVILFNRCKPLIGNFLLAFRENNKQKSCELFKNILETTLGKIWDSLSVEEQLKIIFENKGDMQDIQLSNIMCEAVIYLKKYFEIVAILTRNRDSLVPVERGCWQRSIPTSTEGFKYFLSKEKDTEKLKTFKEIIAASERIDAFKGKIVALAENYKLQLEKHSISIKNQNPNPEFDFFQTLYYLIVEINRKSIERDALLQLESLLSMNL